MKRLPYFILILSVIVACSQREKPTKIKSKTRSALSVMRSNDCFSCHSIEDYSGVPSYRMISERYETNQETINTLTNKVLEGGGGNWGSGLMVKHPFLKPKDAQSIIRWVLSLDADSVLNALESHNTTIYKDTLHRFQIDIYNDEQKLLSGSLDEINLAGNQNIQKGNTVLITGEVSIERPGKYFFYLRKTGTGKMTRGRNMVISEREDDNEIMLELEKGEHPIQIDYRARTSSDTLSLFWLPVGREYYELLK